ncbi:toxin-antitoxin system YwqK family antitoxin [Candidatus Thioglobus sp.]|nr:toxin-antitoxin system YwqK family antitoxin [Candidatus Thioglobus sp.]
MGAQGILMINENVLKLLDFMKHTLLLLILILTTAQANFDTTFRNNLLINPDTNKPYTGNIEVLNNDWGKNAVEFSKDYVDGLLHGAEKTYYQSGKLKSIGYFTKGILDGVVTGYYKDGSVQVVGHFSNGIKDGGVLYYYPNGSKQVEMFYDNGKLQGAVKTWYENGNVMKSIPYSKGIVHGTLEIYYESGVVFEEVEFNFGTPKYMKNYLEDGTVADEKGFFDRKLIDRIVG